MITLLTKDGFMKLICLLSILLFSQITFSAEMVFRYRFERPVVVQSGDDQLIKIPGLALSQRPGMPMLPMDSIKMLLPANARIETVKVQRAHPFIVLDAAKLKLAPKYPFTDVKEGRFEDIILEKTWPDVIGSKKMQKFHGHRILTANIFPVYVTPQKEVFSTREIKITINYSEDKGTTHKARFFDEILEFVDNPNPEIFSTYDYSNEKNMAGYDYLIITSLELISYKGENSLHVFKDYLENEKGLKVKIVNVTDATGSGSGVDNAQKLRNFIRREYEQSGIRYVLIAGDSDGSSPTIPVRKLYSEIRGYNGSWRDIKEHIVADFYYGCLDGTFNGDNDNKCGESNDGEDGGDVDFLCEVTVGRWPVDKTTELKSVVAKTLKTYRTPSREKSVINLGEMLFRELDLWGGDYLNQLFGEVDDHGFVTRGFDESWRKYTLYDKVKRWSGTEAKTLIKKQNPLVVNHLGHSSSSMNMRVNSFLYSGFENTLPYFYYSQGCLAAAFTKNDSIVEKMVYGKGGPFAAVANSAYGLGPEDPEYGQVQYPGTSQILHRYFTNRLMNDNYLEFGVAHQKSKEDILRYIDYQEARWVVWTANFFGDPALALQ